VGANRPESDAMKPRVLIIDQDILTRQSLASKLGRQGCQVFEAGGLFEGEQLVGDREIDVVLLDLRHSGEEAIRFLRKIKNHRASPEIILLTGRENIAQSIQGMKFGAFDDLLPPFEVNLLINRVRAAWQCRCRKLQKESSGEVLPEAIKKFAAAVGLRDAPLWYGTVVAQAPLGPSFHPPGPGSL